MLNAQPHSPHRFRLTWNTALELEWGHYPGRPALVFWWFNGRLLRVVEAGQA